MALGQQLEAPHRPSRSICFEKNSKKKTDLPKKKNGHRNSLDKTCEKAIKIQITFEIRLELNNSEKHNNNSNNNQFN